MNTVLGVTLLWTSITFQGEGGRVAYSYALCYSNRFKLCPNEWHGSYVKTLSFTTATTRYIKQYLKKSNNWEVLIRLIYDKVWVSWIQAHDIPLMKETEYTSHSLLELKSNLHDMPCMGTRKSQGVKNVLMYLNVACRVSGPLNCTFMFDMPINNCNLFNRRTALGLLAVDIFTICCSSVLLARLCWVRRVMRNWHNGTLWRNFGTTCVAGNTAKRK